MTNSSLTGHAIRLQSTSLIYLCLVVALTGFHLLVVERLERPGADPSTYIGLAENLYRHGKYEYNFALHARYPPGFPIVLAGWMWASGQSRYEELLRLMPIFGGAALLVWFWALRAAFSARPAAIVLLLTGSSLPYFDSATRLLMADIPYFFFSGLCVFLLLWLGSGRRRQKWLEVAGIGVVLLSSAFAVLVRSAGLAIGVAFLLWAMLPPVGREPEWRKARNLAILAGLCCLLSFFGWLAWSRTAESSPNAAGDMGSYISAIRYKDPLEPDLGLATLRDYIERMANNAVVRAAQLASIAIPHGWISPTWYSPVVFLMALLPFVGVWSCRSDAWRLLFGLYLMAYLAVYALWPYEESARFVIPIAPVVFLFGLEGIEFAWRHLQARKKRLVTMTVGIAILALVTAFHRPPAGKQEVLALLFWVMAAAAGTVVLLARGAFAWIERFGALESSRVRTAVAAVATVLIAWGLAKQVKAAAENLNPVPALFANEYARQAAHWLRTASPGNVMTGQPAIIHRFTGRLAVFFPPTSDVKVTLDRMRRHQVRFLVVARSKPGETPYYRPSEEERLRRIQETAPTVLRLVHETPDFFVFETDPSLWRFSP